MRLVVALLVALIGPLASPSPTCPRAVGSQAKLPEVAQLTLERIRARIGKIEADLGLESQVRDGALELLRRAEAELKRAEDLRSRAEHYLQATEVAPKRTEELRAAASEASTQRRQEDELVSEEDALAGLDVLIAQSRAEVATRRAELEAIERQLSDAEARFEAAPAERAEVRSQRDDIEAIAEAEPVESEDALITEASGALTQARLQRLSAEDAMLEQEALGLPMRLELLNLQREQKAKEVARLDAKLRRLDAAAGEARTAEAWDLQREMDRVEREAVGEHPLVVRLAAENAGLVEELLDVTHRTNAAKPEIALKDDQTTQLAEVFGRVKAQLERTGLRGIGADVLREQRARLPELARDNERVARDWSDRIPSIEGRQLELTMQMSDLRDLDAATERERTAHTDAIQLDDVARRALTGQVRGLLETRKVQLLSELNAAYGAYLSTLRTLDDEQRELGEIVQSFAAMLDEQLLWVPSTSVADAHFPRQLAAGMRSMTSATNWGRVGAQLKHDLRARGYLYILLGLLLAALVGTRRRTHRRLAVIGRDVGRVSTDRFPLTLEALLLELALAAPLPLAIAFLGWRLTASVMEAPSFFVRALGLALSAAVGPLAIVLLISRLCARRGLVETHLKWRQDATASFRTNLRWVMWPLVLAMLVIHATEHQPDGVARDGLGRLVFIAASILIAVFFHRVLRPGGSVMSALLKRDPRSWLSRLRYVWYPAAFCSPIALAALAAAGYYYTALKLDDLMGQSIWLLLAVLLVRGLVRRWFLIEKRRLSVLQFQATRQAKAGETAPLEEGASNSSAEGESEMIAGVDEVALDLVAIDDQTVQLLRTCSAIALLVGLYAIWADVLPALGVMDQVRLWSTQDAGSAGGIRWTTLQDITLAIVAIVISVTAARNLPGVLEIALLKSSSVDSGVRYAVTTISRYLLLGIGLVIAFSMIGIAWSKVQWLVAALGVGIGFGLQEVIANFVCGLILLFERPIRIGDVVTVGETQGIVSRIRIRATTITDWDRMDLIIPNKQLIVGKVLNWSLTDTVNRIVITIGVAYGSDTEEARELLLQVARGQPGVLDDPDPIATFEGFEDSALKMVLRCYLADFSNRLGVITRLHTAIKEAFEQAGIEISFPQLDLHVRTLDPPSPSGGPDAVLRAARKRTLEVSEVGGKPMKTTSRPGP